MAKKVHSPEFKVGDTIDYSFLSVRSAGRIAECEDIEWLFRRHFWYIVERQADHSRKITAVCSSYGEAEDAYTAACTASDIEAEKRAYDFEVSR